MGVTREEKRKGTYLEVAHWAGEQQMDKLQLNTPRDAAMI